MNSTPPPSRPSELTSFVLNSIDYMPFASMGKSFYEVYYAKVLDAEKKDPQSLSKHTFVDMSRNIHGKWTLRKIFTMVPFFGNLSLLVFDAIHWLKDSFAASTGRLDPTLAPAIETSRQAVSKERLDPALAPAQEQAEDWAKKVLASEDKALNRLTKTKSFEPFLQLISPEKLKEIYEWAQKKYTLAPKEDLFSKLIRKLDEEFERRVAHGDSKIWEGLKEKDALRIRRKGLKLRIKAKAWLKDCLECANSIELTAKFDKNPGLLLYLSVVNLEELYMKLVVEMQKRKDTDFTIRLIYIVSTIADSVTEFQKANVFFKRKISAVGDFTDSFNSQRKLAGLPLPPQAYRTL